MSTKVYNSEDLVNGVIINGPEILENILVDPDTILDYLSRIDNERLDYPIPKIKFDPTNWLIPSEYKNLDIEEFLIKLCPEENYDRLIKELDLYQKNGMIPVLKAMKFLVDTLRKNNIVWGVGRGSSVASYALFLIGLHKIDSVKYNLPIEEFFKGDQNG